MQMLQNLRNLRKCLLGSLFEFLFAVNYCDELQNHNLHMVVNPRNTSEEQDEFSVIYVAARVSFVNGY